MEDRYLFKAKRIDNGEWVEGNIILSKDVDEEYKAIIIPLVNSNMFTRESYNEDLGFENWYKVDQSTICQCTGLKDKNGNLIWENDIVRDDNGNLYKAFWQDRYYQFSWICVKSDKLPIGAKWNFWSIRNYEIEVIGNIFDNPELIHE